MTPVQRRQAKARFSQQRYRARQRGIGWQLDWGQWISIWLASGHFHQRGRGHGKFVMARRGDVGPYAVGRVRIVSWEQNRAEQGCGPVTRARMSASHKGQYRTAEVRAKISATKRSRRAQLERSRS
jgi:hypothetical protein